ncbi:MAG: hypothetical protein ACXACI_14940 [Candidatus Hodarchaeales archaeon]
MAYFFAGYNGFWIIDVSESSNPAEMGNYYDGGYAYSNGDLEEDNIFIGDGFGDLAYVADKEDCLEIIQVWKEEENDSVLSFEILLVILALRFHFDDNKKNS